MSDHSPEIPATAAARALGMGLTAFNSLRDHLTREVDLRAGTLSDPSSDPERLRHAFLVAPAIGGYRRPGTPWKYARSQIVLYATNGISGLGRGPALWVAGLVAAFTGSVKISGEVPNSSQSPRAARGGTSSGKTRGAGA